MPSLGCGQCDTWRTNYCADPPRHGLSHRSAGMVNFTSPRNSRHSQCAPQERHVRVFLLQHQSCGPAEKSNKVQFRYDKRFTGARIVQRLHAVIEASHRHVT
jgi:hypothetical protein